MTEAEIILLARAMYDDFTGKYVNWFDIDSCVRAMYMQQAKVALVSFRGNQERVEMHLNSTKEIQDHEQI